MQWPALVDYNVKMFVKISMQFGGPQLQAQMWHILGTHYPVA